MASDQDGHREKHMLPCVLHFLPTMIATSTRYAQCSEREKLYLHEYMYVYIYNLSAKRKLRQKLDDTSSAQSVNETSSSIFQLP